MRLLSLLPKTLALLCVLQSSAAAASSWTFSDGMVSVAAKGAGIGGGRQEKLSPSKALTSPLSLGASDTLKLSLTTQEGSTAKRPHQAFLLLQDPTTKLDISYPFNVKDSGKAKLELTHKDLPAQLLHSATPLTASLLLASWGSTPGYNAPAFELSLASGANIPAAAEKPQRYGKLPEIRHVFREDPKSPNVLISLVFLGAVLATLPVLLGAWLYLGANTTHLSKALADAPLAHALFLGSIAGIEAVLFLYYTAWNLFQTLPVLGALALVAFLSGSRALTEVQERRLAGLR